MLLQTLLFAINLRVWAKNKINYAFIFEFDPRNQMNYRQFLEVCSVSPCLESDAKLAGAVPFIDSFSVYDMFLV
jgi:hypothetical protein